MVSFIVHVSCILYPFMVDKGVRISIHTVVQMNFAVIAYARFILSHAIKLRSDMSSGRATEMAPIIMRMCEQKVM